MTSKTIEKEFLGTFSVNIYVIKNQDNIKRTHLRWTGKWKHSNK